MGSVLLVFFDFLVFRGKTKKKQNGRTYVPVSGIIPVLLVFWVFCFFEAKPKKTKRQNLCPSIWHGVNTFGFFGFLVFPGFCNILVSDMGSAILFCLCFFEVFALFLYLTWVLPFCFFGSSRFLQYSAFPNKTLASFPKKVFFS